MRSQKDEATWLKQWIRPLGVGVLTGTLACIGSVVIMAALLLTQDLPQNRVAPLALVSLVTGAFVGGFFAARVAKQNGWLVGFATGGALFLLLLIAGGFALLRDVQASHLWVKLAIMPATATVGGIVGINLRKQR